VDTKVLVTYGTKNGATAEIAEKISEMLREQGLDVDVKNAKKTADVGGYSAVILGSAVYIGQWRKPAVKFLKANEEALTGKPVWLFSSGPTGKGDPVELVKGWVLPEKLKPIAERIGVRDMAVFHGASDESKLNALERFALDKIGAPSGDFRDWDAISDWAKGVAETLLIGE